MRLRAAGFVILVLLFWLSFTRQARHLDSSFFILLRASFPLSQRMKKKKRDKHDKWSNTLGTPARNHI